VAAVLRIEPSVELGIERAASQLGRELGDLLAKALGGRIWVHGRAVRVWDAIACESGRYELLCVFER
jgi:hypothetical protein